MEIQFYSAVLLLFYFTISPLCFTQEAAEGKAASRKEFFLLDQDYYLNLRQNESGIILKAGNSLLHPDTERYLTAKLKHLLLYGMKKMALSANYTGDTLDKFYLANRKKVKEKMCDIFLKLYHDFAFKGVPETKRFIRSRIFSGPDYNAIKKHVEVHNYWRLDTDFDEKTDQIRRELRKTLTNTLVYFERCYYYHYYRKKELVRQAYQWNRYFEDPDYVNYFQFVLPNYD